MTIGAVDSRKHLCLAPVLPGQSAYLDGKSIMRSKVANKTTASVRCHMSFIKQVTSLVSCQHAFGAEYPANFLDARINDIVDDLISSDFLSSDSRSTNALHIPVTSFVLNQSKVFPLLNEIHKKGRGTRSMGATNMGIRHFIVETWFRWSWCFKPQIFWSIAYPSHLCFILCLFIGGQISFCRACDRLHICM